MKLEEAIEIVLRVARSPQLSGVDDAEIRAEAVNVVEDFFVNNVFLDGDVDESFPHLPNIFVTIRMLKGLVDDVNAYLYERETKEEDNPDEYWDNGIKVYQVRLKK